MYFGACLGGEELVAEWRGTVQAHATWLSLVPFAPDPLRLRDGTVFAAAWLESGSIAPQEGCLQGDGPLEMTPSLPARRQPDGTASLGDGREPLGGADSNLVTLSVSPQRAEIRITLPPTTPEPFYYARDQRGWVLGNDLRLLMRWAGDEIDERAVYAVLQYGAVPPPFTLAKRISRAPNGHVVTLSAAGQEPSLECSFQLGEERDRVRGQGDPSARLVANLDRILSETPRSGVLYFSGGIDSGLLAARLAHQGRTDIRLIHLSLGPGDPESDLARRMAAHLGLRCEQLTFNLDGLVDLLQGLERDYSFPFCDLSTIPTHFLVRHSLHDALGSGMVLEGTGADGTFGVGLRYPFWRRLYGVPRPVRRLASEAYRWLDLWKADLTSPAERLGRVARRSVQMPLSHAGVIAENSLNGIAYTIRGEVACALTRAIEERIEVLSRGQEPSDRFSFLDMVHVCAGIYAAKSYDPLRARGIRAVYPFLEPSTVRIGFSIGWEEKCRGGESKRLLKDLLAQAVPRDMVFRPKSGFLPPFKKILAHSAMQDFFANVVLSRDNPLMDFCHEAKVREMVDRARKKESLSLGAGNLLWALAFTSGWYRQLKFALATPRIRPA